MVKIKINPHEHYEIQMPDVMDRQQFIETVERFNILTKLFGKDKLMGMVMETPILLKKKKYTSNVRDTSEAKESRLKFGQMVYKDKAIALNFLKAYYAGNYRSFLQELGFKANIFDNLQKSTIKSIIMIARKKFSITPQDIGLVAFKRAKEQENNVTTA